MRPRASLVWIAAMGISVLILPAAAQAGMPSITLTDAAYLRVQGISFFLMGVLISAWFIRWLWNVLRKDFPRMPLLSYGRALALVSLWGLLFIIVLTMISGARELMTPGAWEKTGTTYRLRDQSEGGAAAANEATVFQRRREAIEGLMVELFAFAARHGGRFPNEDEWNRLPAERRRLPLRESLSYLYRPGLRLDAAGEFLAWEPQVYDDRPLAILADGRIVQPTAHELRSGLLPESSER